MGKRQRDANNEEQHGKPAMAESDSRLARLTAAIQQHRLITFLLVLAALVTALETLGGAFSSLAATYSRTIGADRAEISRLEGLTPGSTIDRYEDQLGQSPDFVTRYHVQTESGRIAITDHIWARDRTYVQAVTDPEGNVLFHSITVRDGSVAVPCRIPAVNETVTLGDTPYSEVIEEADAAVGFMGASGDFFLGLSFGADRTTGYRTTALSLNDAGYIAEDSTSPYEDDLVALMLSSDDTGFTSEFLESLRRSSAFGSLVPNTCTYTARSVNLPGIVPFDFYLGPSRALIGAG